MPVGEGIISLSEVSTEVYGDTNAGRSLDGCFTNSNSLGFDALYGDIPGAQRLKNFQLYDHVDDAAPHSGFHTIGAFTYESIVVNWSTWFDSYGIDNIKVEVKKESDLASIVTKTVTTSSGAGTTTVDGLAVGTDYRVYLTVEDISGNTTVSHLTSNNSGTLYGSFTTVAGVVAWDMSTAGYTTSALACAGANSGTTRYKLGAGNADMQVNNVIYTEFTFTTTFDGEDKWWYNSENTEAVKINSVGVVTDVTSC